MVDLPVALFGRSGQDFGNLEQITPDSEVRLSVPILVGVSFGYHQKIVDA
jgi:hypothetical protein